MDLIIHLIFRPTIPLEKVPQSTMVWAVPQLFVPNQPTSPAAVASPSTVSLSWNIPNFDGGTPLIGYTIYRGTATGTETYYTTILNVTSFIDTPVTNGTTYYYLIAANNTVGIGVNSSEVSATPYSIPSCPTNINLYPGSTQIGLSWNASF